MARAAKNRESRWIALGEACKLLGVNETTLRSWADSGRIRTFRTPGGHRRFAREEITSLLSTGPRIGAARAANGWPEATLERIRRRLRRRRGEAEEWLQHLDDERKSRLRVLGRRLVVLANDYVVQRRRRSELTEEARYLGLEYARELAAGNVKLGEAIAAFIYFRNALHEAIGSAIASQGGNRAGLWSDVVELEDMVLLAIAEAYEKV